MTIATRSSVVVTLGILTAAAAAAARRRRCCCREHLFSGDRMRVFYSALFSCRSVCRNWCTTCCTYSEAPVLLLFLMEPLHPTDLSVLYAISYSARLYLFGSIPFIGGQEVCQGGGWCMLGDWLTPIEHYFSTSCCFSVACLVSCRWHSSDALIVRTAIYGWIHFLLHVA